MNLWYRCPLLIVCLLLALVPGCTAPPEAMPDAVPAETPVPEKPVDPAVTPDPVSEPSLVRPATPYPTMPARPDPTPSPPPPPDGLLEYITVYSESVVFRHQEKALNVEVPMAPLIISTEITPETITRKIEGVSRYGEKEEFSVVVTRISELARYSCTIRDAETGEIIMVDRFGGPYGHETSRRLTIRRAGVYHITFTGNLVTADITMQLPPGALS